MTATDYLECYQDKKILITGGAGAIGSNLTRAIAELEARSVVVLDDLSSAESWSIPSLPNVLFVHGNVLDEVELKRVFNERPDYIFHLAALFANQNSIDHPETDLMVNGIGTLRILEYAQLAGVTRLIYASSGCSIYGKDSPLPFKEEYMSLDLSSPYQITKMLGELYCNFFQNHYGLQTVRARFFNSYGPGEIPGQYRNVIPNFVYWARNKLPLPITGTGEETRDFTYVGDIVDGLLRAGYYEDVVGEAINLASGQETKIIDLANMINDGLDNPAGIQFAEKRKWDTKSRLRASIDKAGKLIGYKPEVAFKEGLEKTFAWFEENSDNIERSARFGPGVSSAVREYVG